MTPVAVKNLVATLRSALLNPAYRTTVSLVYTCDDCMNYQNLNARICMVWLCFMAHQQQESIRGKCAEEAQRKGQKITEDKASQRMFRKGSTVFALKRNCIALSCPLPFTCLALGGLSRSLNSSQHSSQGSSEHARCSPTTI